MIPFVCPSCRSLRISGSRARPHCRECGRYLSQKSLSRQRHKRAVLGCDGRKYKAGSTASIRVCGNDFSKHETRFR